MAAGSEAEVAVVTAAEVMVAAAAMAEVSRERFLALNTRQYWQPLFLLEFHNFRNSFYQDKKKFVTFGQNLLFQQPKVNGERFRGFVSLIRELCGEQQTWGCHKKKRENSRLDCGPLLEHETSAVLNFVLVTMKRFT